MVPKLEKSLPYSDKGISWYIRDGSKVATSTQLDYKILSYLPNNPVSEILQQAIQPILILQPVLYTIPSYDREYGHWR